MAPRSLTASGSGETIVGIAESPPSGRPRRLLIGAGALVGAAAVGVAWLLIGTHSTSSAQSSLDSLGQAPGIAPPDYAYLDNASVALYLGQLQGGIAKSEQLTQQLTQGRSAGVTAGGLALGGSIGSSSQAERVVTPTATARFYQLLDLLGRDGYLHTVNEAGTPAEIEQAFAAIPEGSFVKLTGCTLRLPSYIRLKQILRASHGLDAISMLQTAEQSGSTIGTGVGHTYGLLKDGKSVELSSPQVAQALRSAGRIKGIGLTDNGVFVGEGKVDRELGVAIKKFDKTIAANPRVPLSSCDGNVDLRPRGVDLLFPIRLANLSSEESLLAGPVTLVGKLVRAVRKPGQEYVDDASLATFSAPVDALDMTEELTSDAVVLAPGAVILPIAIYK